MMSEGDDARKAFEKLEKQLDELNSKVFNNGDDLRDNIISRINSCNEITEILNKARDAQRKGGNP
jgi:hypothetical protein